MHRSLCSRMTAAIAVLVVLASARTLPSQTPPGVKISAYAPAEDLVGQVDYYIKRLEASLADPNDFDLAKQSRVWKDANTLAVLALVLANHDQQHPLKGSMGAMLAAAKTLATAEDDAEKATAALAAIKAARAAKGETAGDVKWEKVASVPALMKQVPLIHAGLRRAVQPNRLARLADESAGQAATLAAIAQVAMLDRQYGATEQEAAQWSAFCAEMRDASGEVNSAIHALDQARVGTGTKRLLESCDACHAKFRQQ